MRTENTGDFILASDLVLDEISRGDSDNSISETLDFKMFWGSMPPDLSRGSRPRRSLL